MNELENLKSPDAGKAKEFKEGDVIKVYGKNGDLTEQQLVERINKRIETYKPWQDELKKVADVGRKYYNGQQIDKENLLEDEIPAVVNKIIQSIETIIPIATETTPEPQAILTPDDRQAKHIQNKLYKFLKQWWEIDGEAQQKLEIMLRNFFTSRFGVIMVCWDEIEFKPKLINLTTNSVLFPKEATTEKDAGFIVRFVQDTVENVIARFPEKEIEIKSVLSVDTDYQDGSLMTYAEYWEDTFVAYKFKHILLGYERNPYYNFADNEDGTPSEFPYNHFKSPRHPFIFINLYNFGDSIADDVSFVELAKELQDLVNKRKKSIEQNSKMANGMMIVAGNKVSKESVETFDRNPGDSLVLENADDISGAVEFSYGRAFDQGIYNDLQDSKDEIDNIFGTHSTTRGEQRVQETAVGRQLMKDSDVGRIGLLERRLEIVAQKIYDYLIQFIYVYVADKYPLISTGDKENVENDKSIISSDDDFIIRDELKDYSIKILVKKGSTRPKDSITLQSEAVQLANMGKMSTIDMYKALEYPNPEKLARNAFLEMNDPKSLYMKPEDEFDVKALRDLEIVINQKQEYMDTIGVDGNDPETMQKYMNTLYNYIKGNDLDQDLPLYTELDLEVRQVVNEFVLMEKEKIKAIMDQFAQEQGMDQQALAMQQGMNDPAAQQAQVPEQQTPEQQPAQQPIQQPAIDSM